MMPGPGRGPGPRDKARKKRPRARVLVAAVIMSAGVTPTFVPPGPRWGWAGLVLLLACCGAMALIITDGGGRRGDRGTGSGLSVHGENDDDDGPAGAPAHRWRVLAVVSRLMPRAAGCRWLAEAESLLSEITAARRGAAFRSYLLSAPGLIVMMWARQALRRARPGPRRPG